jgi:hypothetical protein
MRHAYCIISVLSLLMFGCKSKPEFLPGLEFGQSESEWKQIQKDLVKEGVLIPMVSASFDKDTLYLFKWALNDTSYVMSVYLNGDADKEGSLRMYSLSLTQNAFPKALSSGILKERSGFSFYSASDIESLKRQIHSKYGKPDSISTAERDSSFWYKSENFDMEVRIPKAELSSAGPIYFGANVFAYSKSYKSDYEKFIADQRSLLKPQDVFSIDFNAPKLSTLKDEFGLENPVLEITSVLESSPSHLFDKSIASAKGKLRILDKYNDVLFELADQDYTLSSPLVCGSSWIIQKGKFGWNLSLANRPETKILREAVLRGSTLKAEFKPQTILFTDGTILR